LGPAGQQVGLRLTCFVLALCAVCACCAVFLLVLCSRSLKKIIITKLKKKRVEERLKKSK